MTIGGFVRSADLVIDYGHLSIFGRSVAVTRQVIQLIPDHDYHCGCTYGMDWHPYGDTAVMYVSAPPSESELDLWVSDGVHPDRP